MTLQQPADPFFIDITAIWGLLHRWRASALHQGPQRPCSELSRLCLNGILIVSSFCVVVVFLSFCFLLFCPLCTFADASFDIYPPLSNQVRLISLLVIATKVIFEIVCDSRQGDVGGRVSVNKRAGRWMLPQAISVQSINFQDVRQK